MISVAVEADFGAGWVDITEHTRSSSALVLSRGFPGDGGPTDCCARTGTATFVLDNTASASGRPQGYWSPGHASCRAGWGFKTPVRVVRTQDAVAYTRFAGWVSDITPEPGRYRSQAVKVTVADWMDEAAITPSRGASLAVEARANEALDDLVALVPRQPTGTSYAQGISVFPLALDDVGNARVMGAMARVAQSEGGQVFVAADGTLTFHSRLTRLTASPSAEIADTMVGMSAPAFPGRLATVTRVTAHPRRVDAPGTRTVLASMDMSSPLAVAPGQILVVESPYLDANNQPCAGVDMVPPIAGTDYRVNSRPDGTGVSLIEDEPEDGTGMALTDPVDITATYGTTRVVWTITNMSDTYPAPLPTGGMGELTGYVTLLQARGRGLYGTQDATFEARAVTDTIDAYGERELVVDLPYESDPNVAQAWADWWLLLYGTPQTDPGTITFIASADDDLAAASLLDLNVLVSVSETMTALRGDPGAFEELAFPSSAFSTDPTRTLYAITGIAETYRYSGAWLEVTWQLTPTLTRTDMFTLDDDVYGLLDDGSTVPMGVLGYM
jgi:hypothetical protein